ncbi:hypothetical protein MLD52_12810 [Puniceicoccaceae bacterium K14]|nr:hypothetical protein [Puniceicoccaceae bacterium K14]
MAWRIEQFVTKGVIVNTTPGIVTGKIWLKGLNTPIELNLEGNCYRDLAGTKLFFKNASPTEGDYAGLDIFQDGKVGDMTASQKVKALSDSPIFPKDGEDPEFTLKNGLYLEWFSESNGRVLIETTDYSWRVSLPNWRLSEQEESEQRNQNKQAMFEFMDELSSAIASEPDPDPTIGEMDEFQWEVFLQKNDARSDMIIELFEKYEGHPNCEDIIAEAMGWDYTKGDPEEMVDEIEEEWDDNEFDESEDYLPSHPLISSMIDITSRIFYEAESKGLLSSENSNPWNQLLWHSQMVVGKLIAALEDVSEEVEAEPGFVVATLKRSLHVLHTTIATLEAVGSVDKKRRYWCSEIRRDLFAVREAVLNLMQIYRNQD